MFLSIGTNIKYSVLDILRSLGINLVDIIYKTIDVLYDVAHSINSLNFIKMLENAEESPFIKIFNAFFVLAFALLFLFAVWKITFRIFDSDTNEQPIFDLVKEIIKCGFLIFSVYLIFNTSIDIGANLSNAIYNNFNVKDSSIGNKMSIAYLTINDSCMDSSKNDDNTKTLKEAFDSSSSMSKISSVKDGENLIRSNKVKTKDLFEETTFNTKCSINTTKKDNEAYFFKYNFLFGIVIGIVFLFAVGFSVIMLGRRQLELAFLMIISPLVIATSVGRKEQRAALYQQLASLVLQAAAMMLLIGLTSLIFNVIQNSTEINNLDYFTKIVTQTVLYLECTFLLMTGCNSLNRFIGENVSANSGRDMMLAMAGLGGGIATAGKLAGGLFGATGATIKGTYKTGKGIGQLAKGTGRLAKGLYGKYASNHPKANEGIANRMNEALGKSLGNMMKANELKESSNPIARAYGRMIENRSTNKMKDLAGKWDFQNNKYNPEMVKSGTRMAREGINNIREGVGGAFNSIRNIGNPYARRYSSRQKIRNYGHESDRI